MICVFCVSHAPAIETLDLTRYNSSGPLLLLYFLLVIFCADLFSVLASSILGGIPLRLNRNKTVKGISVGSALAMLVGVALFWLTPFNLWQTAIFSLAIVLSGCMGDLVISAVKRSLGSRSYEGGALYRPRHSRAIRTTDFCRTGVLSPDGAFFHLFSHLTTKAHHVQPI